jgi:hypothetical protein
LTGNVGLPPLLQVGPGRERAPAGAAEDDDPHLGVEGDLAGGLDHVAVQRARQRVHALGAVEGEPRRVAPSLVEQLVSHVRPSPSPRPRVGRW